MFSSSNIAYQPMLYSTKQSHWESHIYVQVRHAINVI